MLIDEVPFLGLVHVAIKELQKIKKEDKPFEESKDIHEVVYLDEGELLDDVHSSEHQDLLLGGSIKLEDEDYEISSEVVCSFYSDGLDQDLEMNSFQ